MLKTLMIETFDLDHPIDYRVKLNEQELSFQDSVFDILGLTESENIRYLNFDDYVERS